MGFEETLRQAQEAATVRRVYGEPYSVGDATIIPAAAVRGGGGGGGGGGSDDAGNQGSGEGLGYGLSARPVGAFVHRGESWRWVPAFDLNRFLVIANLVPIVFVVTRWLIERSRLRTEVKIARSGR